MAADELTAEISESAERYLEASSTLIAVHLFAASAEMVCMAIEMAAGYLLGSQARTPSKASFLLFAERYLPDLGQARLEDQALAERPRRPLHSCAELVYECYRGGLLHDGQRATGILCVDDKGKWMLSLEPDGSARLNAIPFQAQFERGLRQYLKDLPRDPDLRALAERRSAFLDKPTIVPRR